MFHFFRKKPATPENHQDALRVFESAQLDLYTGNFLARSIKTNADIVAGGENLRKRSREMAKNSDDYRKYLRMCERNIVGANGFKLQPSIRLRNGRRDEYACRYIDEEYRRFSRTGCCTANRKGSMRSLDKLIIRAWRVDGEVFLRRVRGFGNTHRLAYQLLDPSACPLNYSENLPDGRRIRMGIELDEWDAPTAYYFHCKPMDAIDQWCYFDAVPSPEHGRFTRIPASEINHFYTQEFPNQLRGIPFGQSAFRGMAMLDDYCRVELIAADACSRKLGKMINEDISASYGGRESGARSHQPRTVTIHQDAGSWDVLHGKWKMETYDPQHPVGNFGPFLKAVKRGIANGLDVAYNTFANDLEGVNFSSIRSGVLDERDAWMDDQEKFIEELKLPEFAVWLEMQFLRPDWRYDVREFDRLNNAVFLARRWQWVDPESDAKASILKLSLGATTPQDIAADLGNDFNENAEAIAAAGEKLSAIAGTVANVNTINGAVKGNLPSVPTQTEGGNENE